MKLKFRKLLSMLLTAAMVLNVGLTSVFAEGVPLGILGLTDCHTKHDSNCGYTETITISGCTHEHKVNAGDCRYTEGTVEQPCTFIQGEDVEATPANETEHNHDENCGYAPATEGTPCTHEHSHTCGYGEIVTVTSPCTHSCEVCQPLDGGELIHGEDGSLSIDKTDAHKAITLTAQVKHGLSTLF